MVVSYVFVCISCFLPFVSQVPAVIIPFRDSDYSD